MVETSSNGNQQETTPLAKNIKTDLRKYIVISFAVLGGAIFLYFFIQHQRQLYP